MSEPAQLAKGAREVLAAALNALQSNGGDSPEIEALAEPIAQAMNIMHRIERSDGQNLEGRDIALNCVRDVLNRLQKLTVADPVVDVLMEHVATSLSKVHALTRVGAPAPAPAPARLAVTQPSPGSAAPPSWKPPLPAVPAPPPSAPAYMPPPPPPPAYAAPAYAAPAAAPAYAAPAAAPAYAPPAAAPPAAAPAYAPPAAAPPAAAPAYAPPAAAPPAAAPAYAPPPAAPPAPAANRAVPAGTPPVDVELGAFTASNFYKGLGGSDVIEHGGIFVATYKIPKIGAPVSLRVRLPGNYEFFASALVQWTREAGGSGDAAEPGFGARFTQIAPEGRQLVYRYTRNREPIFYDDL